MEILLIGNGFDIEHKLPTSYNDFLLFCLKVMPIFSVEPGLTIQRYTNDYLESWKIDESVKKTLTAAFNSRYEDKASVTETEYDTGIRTANSELNEFYSYIKFNTWLRYFQECSHKFGRNWIDFESEISNVIQALDAAKFQTSCGGDVTNVEKHEQELLVSILKASKGSLKQAFIDVPAIINFGNYLNSELEKLIRALEIYLAAFVRNIPVNEKSTDIEKISPDFILSFNYTDTYCRVYGDNNTEYDYIHGKAELDKNVETCNIVLGIDEYLDNDVKDIDLDFLTFKKYYQRIYKSTGNKYLDWVDEIKEGYAEYVRKMNDALAAKPVQMQKNDLYFPWQRSYTDPSSIKCPQHTLYIFGHSLDSTDKDILKLFICNDNVQTKIFYHRKNQDDKKSLGKLIKNLVQIMGQEELIRRTGGAHKTIEFIPQTLRQN